MKRQICFVLLALTAWASGQQNPAPWDKLLPSGKDSPSYYFDAPSEGSPVDWGNSCLLVVRRTKEPLKVWGPRQMPGVTQMEGSVLAASALDAPKTIALRLSWTGPPQPVQGDPRPSDQNHMMEQDLPPGLCCLALVTKPKDKEWREFKGPVAPRMIVVTDEKFRPTLGKGIETNLRTLFRHVASGPADQAPLLTRWLYSVWRERTMPLIRAWQPEFPPDNRLAWLSKNPIDVAIANDAIRESEKAGPSEKPYLTLLGAIWGADAGFKPFIDSCLDPKANPNAGILVSEVASPGFHPIPMAEGIELAQRAGQLGGVLVMLSHFDGDLSLSERRSLFVLAATLQIPSDRRYIYLTMCHSLPANLIQDYPEGLLPLYKSDGTTTEEAAYRAKWAKYLGLPSTPPPSYRVGPTASETHEAKNLFRAVGSDRVAAGQPVCGMPSRSSARASNLTVTRFRNPNSHKFLTGQNSQGSIARSPPCPPVVSPLRRRSLSPDAG